MKQIAPRSVLYKKQPVYKFDYSTIDGAANKIGSYCHILTQCCHNTTAPPNGNNVEWSERSKPSQSSANECPILCHTFIHFHLFVHQKAMNF